LLLVIPCQQLLIGCFPDLGDPDFITSGGRIIHLPQRRNFNPIGSGFDCYYRDILRALVSVRAVEFSQPLARGRENAHDYIYAALVDYQLHKLPFVEVDRVVMSLPGPKCALDGCAGL